MDDSPDPPGEDAAAYNLSPDSNLSITLSYNASATNTAHATTTEVKMSSNSPRTPDLGEHVSPHKPSPAYSSSGYYGSEHSSDEEWDPKAEPKALPTDAKPSSDAAQDPEPKAPDFDELYELTLPRGRSPVDPTESESKSYNESMRDIEIALFNHANAEMTRVKEVEGRGRTLDYSLVGDYWAAVKRREAIIEEENVGRKRREDGDKGDGDGNGGRGDGGDDGNGGAGHGDNGGDDGPSGGNGEGGSQPYESPSDPSDYRDFFAPGEDAHIPTENTRAGTILTRKNDVKPLQQSKDKVPHPPRTPSVQRPADFDELYDLTPPRVPRGPKTKPTAAHHDKGSPKFSLEPDEQAEILKQHELAIAREKQAVRKRSPSDSSASSGFSFAGDWLEDELANSFNEYELANSFSEDERAWLRAAKDVDDARAKGKDTDDKTVKARVETLKKLPFPTDNDETFNNHLKELRQRGMKKITAEIEASVSAAEPSSSRHKQPGTSGAQVSWRRKQIPEIDQADLEEHRKRLQQGEEELTQYLSEMHKLKLFESVGRDPVRYQALVDSRRKMHLQLRERSRKFLDSFDKLEVPKHPEESDHEQLMQIETMKEHRRREALGLSITQQKVMDPMVVAFMKRMKQEKRRRDQEASQSFLERLAALPSPEPSPGAKTFGDAYASMTPEPEGYTPFELPPDTPRILEWNVYREDMWDKESTVDEPIQSESAAIEEVGAFRKQSSGLPQKTTATDDVISQAEPVTSKPYTPFVLPPDTPRQPQMVSYQEDSRDKEEEKSIAKQTQAVPQETSMMGEAWSRPDSTTRKSEPAVRETKRVESGRLPPGSRKAQDLASATANTVDPRTLSPSGNNAVVDIRVKIMLMSALAVVKSPQEPSLQALKEAFVKVKEVYQFAEAQGANKELLGRCTYWCGHVRFLMDMRISGEVSDECKRYIAQSGVDVTCYFEGELARWRTEHWDDSREEAVRAATIRAEGREVASPRAKSGLHSPRVQQTSETVPDFESEHASDNEIPIDKGKGKKVASTTVRSDGNPRSPWRPTYPSDRYKTTAPVVEGQHPASAPQDDNSPTYVPSDPDISRLRFDDLRYAPTFPTNADRNSHMDSNPSYAPTAHLYPDISRSRFDDLRYAPTFPRNADRNSPMDSNPSYAPTAHLYPEKSRKSGIEPPVYNSNNPPTARHPGGIPLSPSNGKYTATSPERYVPEDSPTAWHPDGIPRPLSRGDYTPMFTERYVPKDSPTARHPNGIPLSPSHPEHPYYTGSPKQKNVATTPVIATPENFNKNPTTNYPSAYTTPASTKPFARSNASSQKSTKSSSHSSQSTPPRVLVVRNPDPQPTSPDTPPQNRRPSYKPERPGVVFSPLEGALPSPTASSQPASAAVKKEANLKHFNQLDKTATTTKPSGKAASAPLPQTAFSSSVDARKSSIAQRRHGRAKSVAFADVEGEGNGGAGEGVDAKPASPSSWRRRLSSVTGLGITLNPHDDLREAEEGQSSPRLPEGKK